MITGSESNTHASGLTRTFMHTYQADLEKAEKDLAESQKVSALAGRGRVHMPRACALRAFANAGVCTMQARDGYVGEWKARRGDSRDGK